MKDPKEMRFLIVDDMSNMVRTVRNMLRHLGYQHTMEAEDGVSAWKVLKNNKIDFVHQFYSKYTSKLQVQKERCVQKYNFLLYVEILNFGEILQFRAKFDFDSKGLPL